MLVRGEKARVWDESGKEYIDCTSGHGVASLGHSHPALIQAVSEQTNRLITCSTSFYNDIRAGYLKALASVTPAGLDQVFLCNSGTESVEAALKFARFSTGRTGFVAAVRGFHGRTMGALSVTFNPEYRKDFEPLVGDISFVPFNNIDRLSETVSGGTAAVILEVVQGEGGVRIADFDYLRQVRKLCTELGILLIIDEVQTGFCRTGKFWACEHAEIVPDILCSAKAIAGGLPMGATICSHAIAVPVGKHGSTFGGNPLACAAAQATIDIMIREEFASQAEAKGRYFSTIFPQGLPGVIDVRQIGLMIGIELKERVAPYLEELQERGILAMPAGKKVLRLLPPLVISEEELEQVVFHLHEVLKET